MIHYMQIENFKSLKKISLPLQNLNLFFGMNGTGKSSVIQLLGELGVRFGVFAYQWRAD